MNYPAQMEQGLLAETDDIYHTFLVDNYCASTSNEALPYYQPSQSRADSLAVLKKFLIWYVFEDVLKYRRVFYVLIHPTYMNRLSATLALTIV